MAEPYPQGDEAAFRTRQAAGARFVALARTGAVVGIVALLTGLADSVAAHRWIATEDGGGQLIGAGARHALDEHVPGAGSGEEKLAIRVLAGSRDPAVVVLGGGRASGLHVEVEVGLAVVDTV